MRWVGSELLSDEPVTAVEFTAVAALPSLTAPQVAEAFEMGRPVEATDEAATGKGWSVTVTQSEFTTSMRFAQKCGQIIDDPDSAIVQARAALTSLGLSADQWTWFTVDDASGTMRVIAEPNIDGRQTWATGSFVALVDGSGVCVANGSLMAFEDSGAVQELDSADETFEEARHAEELAIAGDYTDFEQSWTLLSAGRVVPLWRFIAKSHAIIAVHLGDGLETVLDTKSFLQDSTGQED